MDAVYPFYADTFYRHGHDPYLNLDFFKRIAATMPIGSCSRSRGSVPRRLPWPYSSSATMPCSAATGAPAATTTSLHFETCYYQGIEYCIERGLGRFEPGTQGEHKVPRGFVPTMMSSAHFVADPRFAAAVRDFAAREARASTTTRPR